MLHPATVTLLCLGIVYWYFQAEGTKVCVRVKSTGGWDLARTPYPLLSQPGRRCVYVCAPGYVYVGDRMSPDLVLPHLEKSVTHMSQLLSSEGLQERKEIEGGWTPAGGVCGFQGHLFLSLAHPSRFWTQQLPVHALRPRHTLVLTWLLTTLLFPVCLCLSGLLLATLWGFSLASSKSAGLREMSWIHENQPHIGARCFR